MEDPTKIAEGVDTLSKSMIDYGTATVIIAAFLLIFIIIVLSVFLANQKQVGNMAKQYKELFDLVKTLVKEEPEESEKSEPEHNHGNIVQMYMNINFVFKKACRAALYRIKADRVGIYVFHNGSSALHGLPFFKMTCVGESILFGNGINSKGRSDTDLPLHMFSDIIGDLYRNGEYYSERNDNEPILADFISNSNINFVFIKGIYKSDVNGDPSILSGFTIAEFNKAPANDEELNDIRRAMLELDSSVKDIVTNPQVIYNLENRY